MTDQHPITPSRGLVEEWVVKLERHNDAEVFTEAARWGADQELDACCEWLDEIGPSEIWLHGNDLRIDRRPQPKSRKQRALDALTQMESQLDADLTTEIRQALEELPDD